MRIEYHRNFKKALRRQPKKIQGKFLETLKVFVENQFHYSLNNHALSGKFLGTRSFDVTGNVRVHYEELENGMILMNIGTHSQLYS